MSALRIACRDSEAMLLRTTFKSLTPSCTSLKMAASGEAYPTEFGNWHSIYTRMSRWSKNGVLDRIFERLQRERLLSIKIEAVSLDSTTVKVHPDGMGALKNRSAIHRKVQRRMDNQNSYGCRVSRMRADIQPFPGNAGDAPQGRSLLERLGPAPGPCSLLMDRAYEGNETQCLP